ncbi:MAG: PilC/PilY family type IV pilus protein [Candidatus Krumholzibacteriota bacterium]
MLIHRNQKLWTVAVALLMGVSLAALTAPTDAAAQDVCEVPLFVKQNSGGANLMILADNSFSMNTVIYHFGYNKDVVWTGFFQSDAIYFVAKDGWYTPADFNSTWPVDIANPPPSIFLVNSDNGEDGRYEGNYLNWLYYNATVDQLSFVPNVTRVQVLKMVLNNIIARSARLNMGICVFQKNDTGGNLVGPIGKSHTALQSIIAGITANALTPTGESLETILDYFGDKVQSPITSECQYNFILLVTDGLPTVDQGVSPYLWDADGDGNDPGDCTSIGSPYDNSMGCSDHMDDVAWWMANEDIYAGMDGVQNVYTYVVGYHADAPLLEETAINGQGLYFEAKNAVELFLSIEYALQDILRRISAGSAVAVVSTERGTDDRLYRGKFMPIDWAGYLECYALPYQQDDQPLWEAGNLLRMRNKADRMLFTAIEDHTYKFETGNASVLRDEMGAVDDDEAARLIHWGRGNYVPGYRYSQDWVLGDIIHSTPVVVGPPSQFAMEQSYEDFRKANEHRRKMVYVGANDGMLHGFDAETGHESWGFVPQFALPKFAAMADSAYCHNYTCDQTVTVKDVMIDGVWKTVLITGGGAGSASIFALDVTNPDLPNVLWQADLPNGKKDHSQVEVVTVNGRPVALVGSGLDTVDMASYLYAYDISSGNLLGSALLSQDFAALRNKTSRPAVVDINLDGQTDLVYVADMLGSVYRVALQGSAKPSGWSVSKLYEGTQEIQADPIAAYGPNGAIYVYFGTGAYIEDPDMSSLGQNSFLCVFDHHDGSTATMASMADQTSGITSIGASHGWYVNLWNDPAERVTKQAVVVAETVIFSSFAPSDDPCVAGGVSWLYQMKYENGGIPDVDYMVNEEDRSVSLGEGIASYPVVDLSEGNAVVQSSNADINVEPIAAIIQPLRVRSWQENFDHVAQPPADATAGGPQ